METYILFYSVKYITEPTRVKSKEFNSLQRAQAYYNACRADWYEKACKEYQQSTNHSDYGRRFEDYFKEYTNPEKDVLAEFGGEIGWTTYNFSLEKV